MRGRTSAWTTGSSPVVTKSETRARLYPGNAGDNVSPISSLPGLIRQSMMTSGMRTFWVYILASQPRETLYIDVTNNLIRRIYEHREGLIDGFTREYAVKMLVYYEQHATAMAAIQREKNIKHWSRSWKIDLIRSMNPDWHDLWKEIAQ
jgi:putative endonuclease